MPVPVQTPPATPEFDQFAGDYDAALNQGLKFSGETKEYFAENRVQWLRKRLGDLSVGGHCLDYGCGTGTAAPYLVETLGLDRLTGVDLSEESLAVARKSCRSPKASFQPLNALDGLKNAIVLFPGEARRLMRNAGFEVLDTDFLFVFPAALSVLRGLEPALCKLPLGGQYQVLCRKPAG